ncbi:hybrid sensor histidine kinase/response regulator [Noviherbaspirillum aerium]|uniref:hybrid sensor histidine kinase/response regulator n=1 Tax=Noviherbaspirillum aerium TaxID=2588497 RepID=UPI00124E8DC8|nr:hybrid sensor histidine kinase/response regulator [Noviherbaspirillum aerium]
MTDDSADDYSGMSLQALFRSEAESQAQVLTSGLLALEHDAGDMKTLDGLMRAAHSLKGAARIVNLEAVERVSHVMEDCFVAAQKGRLQLTQARLDRLLAGVDLVTKIASLGEDTAPAWLEQNKLAISSLLVSLYEAADPAKLNDAPSGTAAAPVAPPAPAAPAASAIPDVGPASIEPGNASVVSAYTPAAEPAAIADDQFIKVNTRSFDRLLSLAGESRVAAHAMRPHLQAMQRLKKQQQDLTAAFDLLNEALPATAMDELMRERWLAVHQRIKPLRQTLVQQLAELEAYERRLLGVSQAMLDEVLALRMRPFRDGVGAFPRMVRDLGRSLGKQVRLEIGGLDTMVDRDILARMETPINQILRNAIDHGMEAPEVRAAAGKPAQGTIHLEARHSAGMLTVVVSDDGQGVDLERIRRKVIERRMASDAMAAAMSAAELLDFLLLPAFSLRDTANEVSGRGVGLDVVQVTVRQLNGTVRLESEPGKGFRTTITLPLSQSIVRAIVIDIGGEAYAVPVTKIERIMRVTREDIHILEDKQFFAFGHEHVGLVSAAQLLELGGSGVADGPVPVVIIGSSQQRHALAVDAIRGEYSLAVQPIEDMFGKMKSVSAAALLDDGSPVLILDIDDVMTGILRLAESGALRRLEGLPEKARTAARRVLVVDDSLTVREVERKLLASRGYDVDVAVDGMDGWNAVRSHHYDLVITDVDMPRMDGIELVMLIKRDEQLRRTPVMIVSYKDRPEDRSRGIEAGADYYLTKGSFHDETLIEAVIDLIGESA